MTMPQTEPPPTDIAEALRTVAINGAYNASRALSKWFKRGVRLTSDGFRNVPLTELSSAAGEPDEVVAAIHLQMLGEIEGDILLAFPERAALRLVDALIEAEPGTSKEFNELEQSCLQETGNIVGSAFANSLAGWLQLQTTPQSPTFVHDLAAAVIQPLIIEQAALGDNALVSRTEFDFGGDQLDWRLILIPSAGSLSIMQKKCEGDDHRQHALQTIAINGAFDASRAMSKWLRRGVRLHTEGFSRIPLREASPPAESDDPVVALHTALEHQLHGHTLVVMDVPVAMQLVDVICQLEPGTTTELDEMSRSCLMETCNIVSSSFINSWAKWLEIHTVPGPPELIVDMPEAVLQSVLVEQAMASDEVFLAKTEFSIDGNWLEWQFYLLPSAASLRLIESSCS